MLPLDEITRLLAKKSAPLWRDDEGNTLLHHAARLGDVETVEACLAKGIKAQSYNHESECPRDTARSWGHDAVAKRIDQKMQAEKANSAVSLPAAYNSLDKIRSRSQAGENVFHTLARQGMFSAVAALAEKDPQGLKASDLLAKGKDGETVLLHVCQQGDIALLMKPALWLNNPSELVSIWENIPAAYKKGYALKEIFEQAQRTRAQGNLKKGLKPGFP